MTSVPNRQELSDQELVKLALKDRDSFLYLVERYQEPLSRYIKRLTNIHPEEAEDILQEIFIKVYLNLNDFDGNLKFSSWVYRIAHNQVISNFRKLKARPEGHAVALDDIFARKVLSDIDVDRFVDQSLLQIEVGKAFSVLSPRYREVLLLRFFDELSYQEISDIIKKPVGTVASLINQAKKELKQYLINL